MFTKIYKWAQKFLSTEPARHFGLSIRGYVGKVRVAITQRILPLLDLLRQNRRARIIFLTLCVAPAFLIFLLVVVLPVTVNPFAESAGENFRDDAEPSSDSTAAEISPGRRELLEKIVALEIEEAFWQARQRLAKSDSINLSVDLADSVVRLEVKGVPVRICKIHRYNCSDAVNHLRGRGRLAHWLSAPFILQKELATLPKAPIKIKEAPKDTIEASESTGEELPVEQRDVHFTLHFDRNLTIVVAQIQTPSFRGWLRKIFYGLRRSAGTAGEALFALARLKLPQHRIEIELELTREDAKAIYRALPPNSGLALRL